jgi:hemerythrin-like domain-containing protein
MRATEVLKGEHRVIEQVLHCLERMASQCERAGRLDPGPARDAVTFFRGFADRNHHGKEEHQLFPMLEARGFSPESGPTAVMRREHIDGRGLVERMEGAIDGAASGDREAVRGFVVWSRTYVQMLRAHIENEDTCLFPMADRVLREADQRALLLRFGRGDAAPADRERFLRMADALADRFDVPRAPRSWVAWRQTCLQMG